MKNALNLKEIVGSYRIMYKKAIKLVFPVMSDLLFFLLFGLFISPVSSKINEFFSVIGTKLIEGTGLVSSGYAPENYIKEMVSINPEIQGMIFKFILLFLLTLFIFFILFTFFQSISWFFCSRIKGVNIQFYRLMLGFAKANLCWIAIFAATQVFSAILFLNSAVSSNAGASGTGNPVFYEFLVFTLFFFSFVSYALVVVGIKHPVLKSFGLFIRKTRYITSSYLLMFLIFFILLPRITLFLSSSRLIMYIFLALAVIPLISWSRIFLISVAENKFKVTNRLL